MPSSSVPHIIKLGERQEPGCEALSCRSFPAATDTCELMSARHSDVERVSTFRSEVAECCCPSLALHLHNIH